MSSIVAVEGLDASGKSTQAALLGDALRANGLSVASWSFPRYETFFGQRIGALLSGNESVTASTLDPRSMALWFAMDRWHAFNDGVPSADVVILNRWTLSNAVYQGARCESPEEANSVFDWVWDLEHSVLGLPQPTVTVVLRVSVETSMARAAARAEAVGGAPDVYERHQSLLGSSDRLYRRAVDRGLAVAVNADNRSASDIAGDVTAAVAKAGIGAQI